MDIRLIEEPVVHLNDSDFDDFKDSEEGLDLGLEAGSLLNYLCARRDRVPRSRFQSMLGLPLCMQLMMHDCLIHQLDRELNYHRSKGINLWDQLSNLMDKWSKQGQQLKELKKEKLKLSEATIEGAVERKT